MNSQTDLLFSRRASKCVRRCSSSGHLNVSLMHLSEFLRESMQTAGPCRRLFILQGWVSRSSSSEASRRHVHHSEGEVLRKDREVGGGGVAREISLKFMCPYRAAESQGVPVTHCRSQADSLSACWALHAPVSVTAAVAITCCWSSPGTRPNWTVMDSRVLGGWVGGGGAKLAKSVAYFRQFSRLHILLYIYIFYCISTYCIVYLTRAKKVALQIDTEAARSGFSIFVERSNFFFFLFLF